MDKAVKIFESALDEFKVWSMEDGDPKLVSNTALACIIFNLIKCHAIQNQHTFLSSESYTKVGMQEAFLRPDEKCNTLFTILSKIQSPLAKGFF